MVACKLIYIHNYIHTHANTKYLFMRVEIVFTSPTINVIIKKSVDPGSFKLSTQNWSFNCIMFAMCIHHVHRVTCLIYRSSIVSPQTTVGEPYYFGIGVESMSVRHVRRVTYICYNYVSLAGITYIIMPIYAFI